FGTGYSALSFLQYNHMNILKIDKAFVDKILITDPNKSLVELIISMAHKLGMEVVAEGVEEKKQVEYLMKHNCDYFQGYLFARPLAIDSVLDLLNDMHRGRQDIKYLYEYNLE
ncbi:MAG TPA: EAL domain-containing protein, partial [Defluviitaleaceae bacterium]|nr:EAL domain-containing protein [Defluviitaleaceae bacterium]